MSDDVVNLHVRFAPDGSVSEISARPAEATPQAWFDWVALNTFDMYRALSGGRGIFTLPREKLDELRAGIAASRAAA
jgi:hypothetical protein